MAAIGAHRGAGGGEEEEMVGPQQGEGEDCVGAEQAALESRHLWLPCGQCSIGVDVRTDHMLLAFDHL